MRGARGVALLWVLALAGAAVALAAGALAVSRMTVTTSSVARSRADGLQYAAAAAEAVASHVRQNADLSGALRPGAARSVTGDLPHVEVGARFEADLSGYDPGGANGRSFLVRVFPAGEALPFTARVTLRSDLTVSEWFVLDHEVSSWTPGEQGVPRFASCSAAVARVTAVGSGSPAANAVTWAFAPSTPAPDEVRVSWRDLRAGLDRSVTVPGGASQAEVSTPLLASGSARPERVVYSLEALFDGVVVDECAAVVVTGRSFFEVSPQSVCAANDSVRVAWDVNAASGVQVVLVVGGGSSVKSTASAGSISVAVPSGANPRVELRAPADVGGTRAVALTRTC